MSEKKPRVEIFAIFAAQNYIFKPFFHVLLTTKARFAFVMFSFKTFEAGQTEEEVVTVITVFLKIFFA